MASRLEAAQGAAKAYAEDLDNHFYGFQPPARMIEAIIGAVDGPGDRLAEAIGGLLDVEEIPGGSGYADAMRSALAAYEAEK